MFDVQENLQKLNLQREKSTLLPTISAFYSHKQSMQSNDFEVFSGGIWYKSNLVGLNVSIPIFGSGQKLSKISQAKISLDKVKNGKLMLQDNLDIGYIRAKSDFKTAFDTYQVEKENKDLSYKIFENAQTRLKNGTMSTLDFNQAQMQYIGTEDAYFQALSRLLDAKINLEKLLNQH
jgi:outer membrane protein TolC